VCRDAESLCPSVFGQDIGSQPLNCPTGAPTPAPTPPPLIMIPTQSMQASESDNDMLANDTAINSNTKDDSVDALLA